MNIDVTKYLKNKDVKVTNDDFDFDKMSKDLYKGYTKDSDIKAPTDVVSKSDYDSLTTKYSELENNYNNTVKALSDTNDKMARVSLESKLTRKGFDESSFDEVIKIRQSVYNEEKDDSKAIDLIADKFKDTYFKDKQSNPIFTKAPDEASFSGAVSNVGSSSPKVTRNTSIKDLFIKK